MMASVSVVIPCYNYGHYLHEAVSSVLDDQPGVDVRVLVIDDASPDGSGEVAEQIASRDTRVQVRLHSTNRGHIATYNEGLLEWADGDYCVLLSADDRLTPGALTRAAKLLDRNPGVAFVFGRAVPFTTGSPLPPARTGLRGWSVWPGELWLERRFRQSRTHISSPEVVVRTAMQKRVGGYDHRLTHAGDQEMWLRLAANGDVGYLSGVDQAYYRRHGQNMSVAYTPLMTLEQYRLAFESVLERYGHRLSDPERLRLMVHRKMAWEALWVAARAYDHGTAEEAQVGELIDFALDCWPRAKRLPMYQTLRLRRRLGTDLVPYLQPLALPAAAVRRAQAQWRNLSWEFRGI
jgi:glycosyltransferase involved in cell wall biosynthesis